MFLKALSRQISIGDFRRRIPAERAAIREQNSGASARHGVRTGSIEFILTMPLTASPEPQADDNAWSPNMRFAEGPSSTRSGHLSCIQRRCFSRGGARRCFTGLQSGMAAPVRADVAFRASAFSQRPQGRKISRSYRLGCRTRRSSNGARQPLRPPPRHSRTGDSRSHGSRSRDTHLRGKLRRRGKRRRDTRRQALSEQRQVVCVGRSKRRPKR